MDIAPLNPKYKLKLGKAYGVGSGNRFRAVEVIEKATGKVLKRIDVKTREGRDGSEETRAKIIRDYALLGLRNNKHSIDATGYKENPHGGKMAKQTSRKKTAKRATKKKAVRRVAKKATPSRKKRVSKKTTARRVIKKIGVKRNPTTPTLYTIKIGSRYYDGGGMTTDVKKACCFKNLEQVKRIGNRLAAATGKSVSIHTNKPVKKK